MSAAKVHSSLQMSSLGTTSSITAKTCSSAPLLLSSSGQVTNQGRCSRLCALYYRSPCTQTFLPTEKKTWGGIFPSTYECPWSSMYVLSGQIESAWEWYHWLGLEKNRHRFSIFSFQFWIFKNTSKFWAASYKNESNLLLVRITVCIESFLPIGWCTFIRWKNPPKGCTILVWIAGCWTILLTSHNPKNNCWLSGIFGARFGGKDCGLWPPTNRNPNKQKVRFIFEWSSSELQSFFKNSKLKLKNQKPTAMLLHNVKQHKRHMT